MKRFFILFFTLFSFTVLAACPDKSVKVMSYNIRLGKVDDGENSWIYRRDAAVEMLRQEAPDCFGVQEAFNYQRDYILEKLPQYKAIGIGRLDGSDEDEHMCVFWNTNKFDLVDGGNFWLSETPDVPSKGWDGKYPRIATWVLLKDKKCGKSFYVINTHLDHKGVAARREGVKLIQSRISSINPQNYPMVIMGDFNLVDGSSVILEFNEMMSNARDCAQKSDRKASFNAWGNPSKASIIDYIYYTGFSSCKEFRTVTGEWLGRKLVSDHNPICAILKY